MKRAKRSKKLIYARALRAWQQVADAIIEAFGVALDEKLKWPFSKGKQ